MGDDLSTGAKIGIGLVILCFLIAIVLALLMVVKNITNSGANQMESGLDQMMSTQFDDYDQKIVTGTKVTTAIKLFQSENVGIVVNTKHSGNDTIYNYGLLLHSNEDGGDETDCVKKGAGELGDAYQFKKVPDERDAGATRKAAVPNKIVFNLNTKPISASGTDYFIRTNGKFMSYLMKDSTGTIVGIYFEAQT